MIDAFFGVLDVVTAALEVIVSRGGDELLRLRRAIRYWLGRIQMMTRSVLFLFVILIGVAFYASQDTVHRLAPFFVLALLLILVWAATTIVGIGGLTTITAIPTTAPFKIGPIISSLRSAVGKLMLVVIFLLVVATAFAVVALPPPGVDRLFLLVILSLFFAAILFLKSWGKKLTILAVALIALFVFFGNDENGEDDQVAATAKIRQMAHFGRGNFNAALTCFDAQGQPLEINREGDSAGTAFELEVPLLAPKYKEGCLTKIIPPKVWGEKWRWERRLGLDGKKDGQVYFVKLDNTTWGPYGWDDRNVPTDLGSAFYIEATKKGMVFRFYSPVFGARATPSRPDEPEERTEPKPSPIPLSPLPPALPIVQSEQF